MKKIEAIIRPEKFDALRGALDDVGIRGMTVTETVGCGAQKGITAAYRGSAYTMQLHPKIKLEIVARDESVDEIIDLICSVAPTGEAGDGKIFVMDVEDVVRVRTKERGQQAL